MQPQLQQFSLMQHIRKHLLTAYLFTKSDFKTIIVPVIGFAVAGSPVTSYSLISTGLAWTWIHLLQANVSNQRLSEEEDLLNKPWRPIPARRISAQQVKILRWIICTVCLLFSYRMGVVSASLLLTVTTIIHDDLHLSQHWIGKAACNACGYLSFEIGAAHIIGGSRSYYSQSTMAFICSAFIIFTTIHAQDFADVIGDSYLGRITLPIAFPAAARVYMLFIQTFWSVVLCRMWAVKVAIAIPFTLLGLVVGGRYLLFKSQEDDKRSYVLYNIWLLAAHLLPVVQFRQIGNIAF